MKRIALLLVFAFTSTAVFSQLEVGASFELRDEEPQSGFGVRIQSSFFDAIPVINFGLRAHASYFSETNTVDQNGNFTYDRTIENYDFGLAAVVGINVGLVEPYVGAGLGSETVDLSAEDFSNPPLPGQEPSEEEESNIYWNTFAGAKVTVIPLVKPFIEYRFSGRDLELPDINDRSGRIIFGVVLSF